MIKEEILCDFYKSFFVSRFIINIVSSPSSLASLKSCVTKEEGGNFAFNWSLEVGKSRVERANFEEI